MMPTIETATGKVVHLLEPESHSICLEDIAHALSRLARFNGHTQGNFPYSVAQHSIWCAWMAQQYFNLPPESVLKVLLHDAHEAYTGDVVSPLKHQLDRVSVIQEALQRVIHVKLAVPQCSVLEGSAIIVVDEWALRVEAHHLLPSRGKDWKHEIDVPIEVYSVWREPVAPMQAYRMFMQAFERLSSNRSVMSPCA